MKSGNAPIYLMLLGAGLVLGGWLPGVTPTPPPDPKPPVKFDLFPGMGDPNPSLVEQFKSIDETERLQWAGMFWALGRFISADSMEPAKLKTLADVRQLLDSALDAPLGNMDGIITVGTQFQVSLKARLGAIEDDKPLDAGTREQCSDVFLEIAASLAEGLL